MRVLLLLAVSLAVFGTVASGQTPAAAAPIAAQNAPTAQTAPRRAETPAVIFNLDSSYLGVYLEEVTADKKKELGLAEERGAIVMKVVAGGPAEKAGLKENDVIVSFNERRVDSTRELDRLIADTPPGRTVKIEVLRGGTPQTVTAVVGNRNLLGANGSNEFSTTWPGLREMPKGTLITPAAPLNFGNFDFNQFPTNRRRMGITAEPMTEQLATYFGVKGGNGVLVSEVAENTPASRAGLRAGDVIVSVENQRVEDVAQLLAEIGKKNSGPISMKVVRDHKELTVAVEPEKREVKKPRAAGSRPV